MQDDAFSFRNKARGMAFGMVLCYLPDSHMAIETREIIYFIKIYTTSLL